MDFAGMEWPIRDPPWNCLESWDDANLLHTKPLVHTATYVWDPLRTVNKSLLVSAHCTLFKTLVKKIINDILGHHLIHAYILEAVGQHVFTWTLPEEISQSADQFIRRSSFSYIVLESHVCHDDSLWLVCLLSNPERLTRVDWKQAETTLSWQSRPICFVQHPSAIAVLRRAQTKVLWGGKCSWFCNNCS